MRKLSLLIGAVVMVAACAAFGAPRWQTVSIATTTNAFGSTTVTDISGYIDEIVLELPSGALTGTVAVAVTPPVGSAITLASKAITATTLVRPRLDATDAAGSAVTGDETWRYLSFGDSIACSVTTANVTGKVWRVWIKWDDGR